MARRDVAGRPPRDPWRNAPTSELADQVLPRWFVLTALVMVPVAVVVAVAAFLTAGPEEVPPAARRPPPANGLTTAVGDVAVGASEPVPLPDPPCPELAGVRVAGSRTDRAVLQAGLAALCRAGLGPEETALVQEFAGDGGVVRFAQFSDTGVDSTTTQDGRTVHVNARFSVTEPAWIAPLVVHDLVTLAGEPGTVGTALAARRAEAAACRVLFPEGGASRACADAAAVLALQDPAAALRAAGYR